MRTNGIARRRLAVPLVLAATVAAGVGLGDFRDWHRHFDEMTVLVHQHSHFGSHHHERAHPGQDSAGVRVLYKHGRSSVHEHRQASGGHRDSIWSALRRAIDEPSSHHHDGVPDDPGGDHSEDPGFGYAALDPGSLPAEQSVEAAVGVARPPTTAWIEDDVLARYRTVPGLGARAPPA